MNSIQNLVQCRYNPTHKLKAGKLILHEDKCPDRRTKVLKVCPYNPVHKVAPENYDRHKRDCPQKPEIDLEAEAELREYLKNKPVDNSTKITNSNTNNENLPIGLLSSNQSIKKERKLIELANGWEMIEPSQDIENINEIKSREEEKQESYFNDFYDELDDPNEYQSKIKKDNKNKILDDSDEDEDDDMFKKIYK